jgi:hypothetical protein
MKKNINLKKGQAIIEYVGLIVIVSLALYTLSMRSHLQRAIQARWKDNVASIGDIQYNSGNKYNITQKMESMEVKTGGGQSYHKEWDSALEHWVWHL